MVICPSIASLHDNHLHDNPLYRKVANQCHRPQATAITKWRWYRKHSNLTNPRQLAVPAQEPEQSKIN